MPIEDPFLEPSRGSRVNDFCAPARQLGGLKTLIEASEAFPAFERMVLGARSQLWLAFRILDPTTRLRSDEARAAGLETWADLLADAVGRGVDVRLFLSDFEPVVANTLHQKAWRDAGNFAARLKDADLSAGGRWEIEVALHPATYGELVHWALWPLVRRRIVRLLDGDGQPHASPLLLSHVRSDGPRPRAVFWPAIRLWPATHHHKMMVADQQRAVLGGLDVNERRYDDPKHERPAEETWHDVSIEIDGPAVADCADHFVALWNDEVERFAERLETARAGGASRAEHISPPSRLDQQAPSAPPRPDPTAAPRERGIQILRTVSRRRNHLLAVVPKPLRTDIDAGLKRMIGSARRLLYIENQFFRRRRIAERIVAQLDREPGLEVIILLPAAPDTVAFDDNWGAESRHGEWLQGRALSVLANGPHASRVGLFALAQPRPDDNPVARERTNAGAIVYLHSKVVIADDRWAMVGSANINGRSLCIDTEIAALWEDREGVPRFRDRLWEAHLDTAAQDGDLAETPLALWRRLAQHNVEKPPQDRRGFVVPFELGAVKRFGVRYLLVPNDFL